MIFLDHRFTIPIFPSRLLGYMQAKIPVLAVTDHNTDIGKVIVDGGFGWWCESNQVDNFVKAIASISNNNGLIDYKASSYSSMEQLYSVENSYHVIERHI